MFFLNTQPLHDLFGRPYKLHLPGEAPPPRGLEPERFLWEDQAERFLRELTAGAEFWRSLIADRDTFSKPMNMSDEAIRRRVAQMLFEGRLHIYRLQIPDPEKSPPAKRRFPAGDGVHYRLEPASARLMNGAGECKRFQSSEEAYRFVETLNPDETQLRQLTADLDVPGAGSGGDPVRQRRALAEALANEQVVVEVERQQRSAPKKEAEYLPAEGPGLADAGLGPATAAAVVAEAAEAEETEPPCDLQRITVECSHGRAAEIRPGAMQQPRLAVVATEKQAKGKDRITAQIHAGALCPRHKNGDFRISREHKHKSKTEKKVVFDVNCAEWGANNIFERVWLPAVRPKTYTVRAKDTCESPDIEIFDIAVDVYPQMKWHWDTTINFGKLDFIPGKAKVQYSDLAIDGNVQLTYDGRERNGKEEFDRYITRPLEGFQKICDTISRVLEAINNPESLMRIGTQATAPPPPEGQDNRDGNETRLAIQWPILSLEYDSELLENSAAGLVDHDYQIGLTADPLLDIDLQVDVLDVFMKMAPTGTSKLIKYAKERVEEGFETKNTKFRGEIDLIFTAAMRVDIKEGSLSGTHNTHEHDLSGEPIKGEIKIPVELKGAIKAEGKWFIVSFKLNYELKGDAGWNGRYEIGKDEKGIYFSQNSWFTGIVVTLTKYEEVKGELEIEGEANKEVQVDDVYDVAGLEVSEDSSTYSSSVEVDEGKIEGEATSKSVYERSWEWLKPEGDPEHDDLEKYYIVRH